MTLYERKEHLAKFGKMPFLVLFDGTFYSIFRYFVLFWGQSVPNQLPVVFSAQVQGWRIRGGRECSRWRAEPPHLPTDRIHVAWGTKLHFMDCLQ